MHEFGRLEAEILVDQDVLRHGSQPLLAAGDVGDLHQMVVDDVCHVVGRHAVGLQEHLHVDGVPRDFDVAIDAVVKLARALGRDLHAHDMRLAGGNARRHFFGRKVEAKAVILRGLAGGALALAHLLQSLGRAETAEAVTVLDDLLDIGTVHVLAVALAIGAIGTTDIRTFRPFEPAPFQRVQHLLFELRRRAGRIGVFNAQDELAAVLLRKEVVEQSDIGRADMRLAGGGGCDAYPDC
ncbi:hypothetical protein D9M70_524100 [compost metagenome]